MPELPEVITVTKDLKKEIKGKTLLKIKITSPYRKLLLTNASLNATVIDVFNIGKQIIIEFDNETLISIHLAMTGQVLLNLSDKYEKGALIFTDNTTIYFSDIRKFGHLKNITKDDLKKQKSKLGINLLENFDKQRLILKLQKRKIPIKNILLDQSVITGAGNIYATDALFLSKIKPTKPANEISTKDYKNLIENLKMLLQEGINHRGSSMNRYLDLYGKPGIHQNHFRVYKQREKNCPVCNNIIKFEKLAGRGSYYCPVCQT